MSFDKDLVKKLSSVKDHLWIGDIEEIRKIANELSVWESTNVENSRLKATTIFRQNYKKINYETKNLEFYDDKGNVSEKKEQSDSEHRFNLSQKFRKRVIEGKLDPRDAIMGSVVDYLVSLRDKYVEAKGLEVTKKEGIKYTFVSYGDKYEARILLEKSRKPDPKYICNQLKLLDFEASIGSDLKVYQSIKAFSKYAYLEIIFFPPRIELRIVPSEEQQANEVLNKIVDLLIS